MKKYIVSFLILCGVLSANCTSNGNGTVTCSDTGLMWQDNADVADSSKRKNWKDAISYCENLILAGHNDWRLPNRNELKSIVDYTEHNPAIKSGFTNTISSDLWTSTTAAFNTSYALGVNFSYGNDFVHHKPGSVYVRCVRAGQ